jgi:hypothetical protein
MAQMIPNMAVLPLDKLPARAQIGKVQTFSKEARFVRNLSEPQNTELQLLGA